jgi:hypothetical protein
MCLKAPAPGTSMWRVRQWAQAVSTGPMGWEAWRDDPSPARTRMWFSLLQATHRQCANGASSVVSTGLRLSDVRVHRY